MGLDGFLAVVIPLGVFFFFGSIMYKVLKEPIDQFIAFIKRQIPEEQEPEEDLTMNYDIIYSK